MPVRVVTRGIFGFMFFLYRRIDVDVLDHKNLTVLNYFCMWLFNHVIVQHSRVAQSGGALGSYPKGRRFKSSPCNQQGNSMTLEEYFATEPRGSKVEMAIYLGITATYISLLIHGKRRTSKSLAISIENATQGLVKRQDLRPDLFVV